MSDTKELIGKKVKGARESIKYLQNNEILLYLIDYLSSRSY